MRKRTNGLRPLQWGLLALAGVVLFLGVAGLVLTIWSGRFLRSEEFRRLVARETGKALGGEAVYAPLRWSGASAYSQNVSVKGFEFSPLAGLEGREIRARIDWRAALGRVWKIEEVTLVGLDASFQKPSVPRPVTEKSSSPPPRFALPMEVSLGALRAETSSLIWIGSSGVQEGALTGSRLLLEPNGLSWKISAEGGALTLPGFPEAKDVVFHARMTSGRFFLTDATGRVGASGKISGSGEFGESSDLRLEWAGVDAGILLPAAWKDRLSGVLSGTTVLGWKPGIEDPSVSGDFVLTEGLLQDIPVLDQIATFTSSPQFRRMPLHQVSGKFTREEDIWNVTDFILESKGLLRVQGGFRVADSGAIEGTLRLGVAPQVLQWIPGSRERVFIENQSGYVWTDVRVGGTINNPKEDLSVRLALAIKDEAVERGTRALSNPAGTIQEGARGVLDALAPLLR